MLAPPDTLPPMFQSCRLGIAVFTLTLPLLLCACQVYAPIQLTPVKTTTPVVPRFTQNYYYFDRDQDLYFVMRSHSTDAASGKPVDQIATVHVFWHPQGGVTTLNSSALNATFRYLVMTPDAVGMYEGAGFVRLFSKMGAGKFNARITDGDMRLSQASTSFVDTLGRASHHWLLLFHLRRRQSRRHVPGSPARILRPLASEQTPRQPRDRPPSPQQCPRLPRQPPRPR